MVKDVNKLHVKRSQWMIECPNCDGQGSTTNDFFGYINCAHCDGEGWLTGNSEAEVRKLAVDVIEKLKSSTKPSDEGEDPWWHHPMTM